VNSTGTLASSSVRLINCSSMRSTKHSGGVRSCCVGFVPLRGVTSTSTCAIDPRGLIRVAGDVWPGLSPG
jgi:hypothetical protein